MIFPGAAVFAMAPDGAARSAPAFALRSSDAELVRRVLSETGVVREPPRPSLASYVAAWSEAIARWIADFFSARPELAQGIVTAMEFVAIGVVTTAAVLLIVVLFRRASRRMPAEPPTPPGWSRMPEPTPPAELDRSTWKAELEACLARGDVAGALEALWWWLAASLSLEVPVDPSWTTRELLVKARRPELIGTSAALDVLMYGRGIPSPAEVRACLARFEQRLA